MARVGAIVYVVTVQGNMMYRPAAYTTRKEVQKAVRVLRRRMIESLLWYHGIENIPVGYSYLRNTAKRVTREITVTKVRVDLVPTEGE